MRGDAFAQNSLEGPLMRMGPLNDSAATMLSIKAIGKIKAARLLAGPHDLQRLELNLGDLHQGLTLAVAAKRNTSTREAEEH